MSDQTCPYCGHDNGDALGVMPLSGDKAGSIDTSRVKCSECKRTFKV